MTRAPPKSNGQFQNKVKSSRNKNSAKIKTTQKKKSSASLKSQLRSKQRLLLKVTNDETRHAIENDVANLEKAIEIRKRQDKEKKYAAKYHRVKFVERQKLTRMEKRCKKNLQEAKSAADFDDVEKFTKQLEQICMDQLYVAYYPNDTKYISLFANGVRIQDDEKTAKKRSLIRESIIQKVKNGLVDTKKSWVNMDVLKAKGFEVDMTDMIIDESERGGIPTKMPAAMKEAREGAATRKEEVDKNQENVMKSSTMGKDDGSSKEESSVQSDPQNHVPTVGEDEVDSSESSSDDSSEDDSSSSSDISSDEESLPKTEQGKDWSQNESTTKTNTNDNEDESDDDFLVEDAEETDLKQVFAKAKREEEVYKAKGDKSMGWKTQKQRPGEWKKRRQR